MSKEIGLIDADGHNFPSLPLMKISAYHKERGDRVEWVLPMKHYDKIYVSRIFGDEYTTYNDDYFPQADEIEYGGTGFAIKVENGREVFRKEIDKDLPPEIEHIYPDYSLYPELCRDTAYGFLTRGCPNNCGFCIISAKEGRVSHKVADLSEFWRGQRHIKLLDANLLACKDRGELLKQLAECGARVDFTQGLDARFITPEIARLLKTVNKERVHFAFDLMKFKSAVTEGLKRYREIAGAQSDSRMIVYILTNYDTTFSEDWERVKIVRDLGYMPDVRIYRKTTAPPITRYLQRWCNNRFVYRSCEFADYAPHKDGRTIKEMFPEVIGANE